MIFSSLISLVTKDEVFLNKKKAKANEQTASPWANFI